MRTGFLPATLTTLAADDGPTGIVGVTRGGAQPTRGGSVIRLALFWRNYLAASANGLTAKDVPCGDWIARGGREGILGCVCCAWCCGTAGSAGNCGRSSR